MAGVEGDFAGSGDRDEAAGALGLDVSVAHPARVYDYLLSGCFL